MKADPADVGTEATSKGASVCRTDARWLVLGIESIKGDRLFPGVHCSRRNRSR
jgi:hypothetical protein